MATSNSTPIYTTLTDVTLWLSGLYRGAILFLRFRDPPTLLFGSF